MKTRACCIALGVAAGIASPYGSGGSNTQDRQSLAGRMPMAETATLVAVQQWTDPQWEYSVNLLEPALRDSQSHSRNPAGRLVLPAPQTSHAPAF